ncbi:MAG: DEAD/DEAH box helicase [Gemmatimonadaceae bacterium]
MTNTIELSTESVSPFAALGLEASLVTALNTLGYEEPTPIQREAIPPLLAGRDVLGQAATGTGKTAAFALPLLQRIGTAASKTPTIRALVLVPTRELAMQVAEAIHRYGKGLATCVLPIYGGQSIQQQLRALRRGVDVIVATPGRALDHIRRGSVTLGDVQVVVLDEADEMLDMGFADDLEEILDALPTERQTALFSATIPSRIAEIAERHLNDPIRVRIAREAVAAGGAPRVRQVAYIVPRQYKVAALGRVLDMEGPTSAIVFCRTRTEVDELSETLIGRGYRAEALHGGLSQEQRDRVMQRFREGNTELLVATDVAARGLDIEHLSHVVNYDVPSAADAYVHRIGRTGRAGREGVAITLAEPREHRLIRNIEQLTKQRIVVEKLPTVLDLRTRQLDLTRAALRETLVAADFDGFRVVVESLAEEFDIVDVATAAVKLAHEATTTNNDIEEIPIASVPKDRDKPRDRDRVARGKRQEREPGARRGAGRRDRKTETDVTRLYIALGRRAGVRPADLVGAIANEAGIDARAVGSIEIADRFSIVEVPDDAAEDIIGALRSTTIRGRRVMVRRDREEWEKPSGIDRSPRRTDRR